MPRRSDSYFKKRSSSREQRRDNEGEIHDSRRNFVRPKATAAFEDVFKKGAPFRLMQLVRSRDGFHGAVIAILRMEGEEDFEFVVSPRGLSRGRTFGADDLESAGDLAGLDQFPETLEEIARQDGDLQYLFLNDYSTDSSARPTWMR